MKHLCLAVLFAGYAALAGAAPGTTTSTSLSLSLLHDMDTTPGILFGVTDGLRFTLGSGAINLEAVNYPVSTFDFLSLQGRGGNLGVGTTTDSGEKMEINGSLRITAATFPTTGKGLELQFDPAGNVGWIFAYNRNTSAYYPVNFKGNSDTTTALATTPTQCAGGQFATGVAASGNANCATPASGITSVSVATTNGFAGSSSGGTSPAITLTTTITGLLKGNGTAISAANAGTDYAPVTSGTGILKGNGAGGFSIAAAGADYQVPITNPITGSSVSGYWPYFSGSTALSGLPIGASKVVCSDTSAHPVACTNLTDSAYLTGNQTITLSGDVTGSGTTAVGTTVAKVNGASLPTSKNIVGTNGSGQLVDATSATLSNNTTGTASNITAYTINQNLGTGNNPSFVKVTAAPVSADAPPTYTGGYRLLDGYYAGDRTASALVSEPGGFEFLASSYLSGSGWRWIAHDLGGGQFPLYLQGRGNSATWTNLVHFDNSGNFYAPSVNVTSATTSTTSPPAGGAAALPATPAGYLTVNINGTNRQIPYY